MDSEGRIYYSTLAGEIHRVAGNTSTRVATVTTRASGNSGLLGMALADDRTAVVHYTTPEISFEVISRVDLSSGDESEIVRLACNVEAPGGSVMDEHHGGNPIVTADGTIFVGIGDFDVGGLALENAWHAGKIHKISPDGSVQHVASGFRNPFDLAWDPEGRRLVVPDNGTNLDDEMNVVDESGGFFGHPFTAGNSAPFDGAKPPVYVFPEKSAPTGIVRVSSSQSPLAGGYLVSTFVTRSILYFPDPAGPPLALLRGDVPPIVDVTEGIDGEILFTTGSAIYRLRQPARGDCDGNLLLDRADTTALDSELADGAMQRATEAQNGLHRGSWGCDADGDGFISEADRGALWKRLTAKPRAIRSGGK